MELGKFAPGGNPLARERLSSTERWRAQSCSRPQYHPRNARLSAILQAL
jgi:hypothetical protein